MSNPILTVSLSRARVRAPHVRVSSRFRAWRRRHASVPPLPRRPARRDHDALAWASRPGHELVRLAWPICVSTLSYSTMTLVDTFFVARFGADALAGVGLAGTMAFVLLAFSFGLLRGTKTLVAVALGANAEDRARRAIATGVVTGVVLGFASLVVGVGVAYALPLAAGSEAAGDVAFRYLIVRATANPAALLFVAIREARYARGDSRSPMTAGVIANVVNIVLDAVFVLGFDSGVEGVAWATVIATVIQALLLFVSEVRRGIPVRAIRRDDVRALVRIGAPTGLQFLLEVGSFSMLTILLARLPSVELAAHQIAIQVIHFGFLPAVAISESVSVLTGQAVGARRLALVHVVSRWGVLLAGSYAALGAIGFALAGAPLAGLFTDDPELASRTVTLLLVAGGFLVVDAAGVIARGALRGVGDVKAPALIGVLCAWGATPPLTLFLGLTLGWGALGGWIGLTVEIFVQAALVWARLGSRRWHPLARKARRAAKGIGE